ncbi:MAG: class I SAM-dependent methyltransferase [Promethearchaeota archaeon]
MAVDELEMKFMNSPLKKIMQKHLEFRIFKRFLASRKLSLMDKTILEVGCGSGYGLELITKEFQPIELVAFDINPEQIRLAKLRRLPVKLFVGNVTNIKLPSKKFDAVFVFTVFHHVEIWRVALKEVNRVLKPRGILLVNELNKKLLNRIERFLKVIHPKASRFDWIEFEKNLVSTGFKILEEKKFFFGLGFFLCVKAKHIE